MDWHVAVDSMTELKTGLRYRLRKHGLTAEEVRLAPADARFVEGHIPATREISNDPAKVRQLVSEISVAGEHFTYFASEYRHGTQCVVLLDYVKGSAV